MKLENNKNNMIELNNNDLFEKQKSYLQNNLGKTINSAFDIGLRIILPDFIENSLIDLKNNLLDYGLKEGINMSIESSIDAIKNTVGIISGDFNNLSQVKYIVKNGGLIDTLSECIDFVIQKMSNKGIINNSIVQLLKNGKNIILDNIQSNIENTFNSQIDSIVKIENHISKWNEYFECKDFNKMEYQYNKLQEDFRKILPIKKIIDDVKIIENLHTLIKNNGKNFNLTNQEIELAKKLI